jgi:hypothetical protein
MYSIASDLCWRSVTVVLNGPPAGPTPRVCPVGSDVAIVASGIVPTAFPTPTPTPTPLLIGPLGICVSLG